MRYDILDYVRGVLAGLVAGIAGGVVFAVGTVILILLPLGRIDLDPQSMGLLYFLAILSFLQGLIIGPLLGLVFAVTQNRFLKNRSLEIKGLVFGTIVWILRVLTSRDDLAFGTTIYAAMIAFVLVGDLTLGYVLGNFYRRLGPKTIAPQSENSDSMRKNPVGKNGLNIVEWALEAKQ